MLETCLLPSIRRVLDGDSDCQFCPDWTMTVTAHALVVVQDQCQQ